MTASHSVPFYLRTARASEVQVLPEPRHAGRTVAPPSLSAAYAALAGARRADPAAWGGWMVGGVTETSRVEFETEDMFFAPVRHDEILYPGARAPGFPLPELKGEIVLTLRLGPGGARFDACALGVVFAATTLRDAAAGGLPLHVADRCAFGALVVGATVPSSGLPMLCAQPAVLEIDGRVAFRAAISDLAAPPEALLATFGKTARAAGFEPTEGEWVSFGGLGPSAPLFKGSQVRVTTSGFPALSFTASFKGAEPMGRAARLSTG